MSGLWETTTVQVLQRSIEYHSSTQWSVVSSPSPGNEGARLSGVTAISANDLWAVGNSLNQGKQLPLLEQWNGTSWRVVSSPSPGGSSQLIAVTAISANDAWTVGSTNESKTLIEQWNGTNWSIVSSPNPGPSGNRLGAVAAISAKDLWAVRDYFKRNDVEVTLTARLT